MTPAELARDVFQPKNHIHQSVLEFYQSVHDKIFGTMVGAKVHKLRIVMGLIDFNIEILV